MALTSVDDEEEEVRKDSTLDGTTNPAEPDDG